MIVYLDSSVLARSYLSDEEGHQQATALLEDPDVVAVTGKWTRIEVSGALLRAARTGRNDTSEKDLLALLDADLAENGRVSELTAPQADVERKALELVRLARPANARHLAPRTRFANRARTCGARERSDRVRLSRRRSGDRRRTAWLQAPLRRPPPRSGRL